MSEQALATSETTEMTDSDIDSTYDALMNGNPTPDVEEAVQAPPPEQNQEPTLKFVHKGKEIVLPLSDKRVTQWLSQGYDYSANTAEFKAQQAEFERQRQEINSLKDQYGPVDEWVKQNPEAWQQIVQQFENQQRGLTGEIDPNNPLTPVVQQLQQELAALKPQVSQVLTAHQAEQMKAEDAALDNEIKSVQEQYPDLDLAAVGEDGSSMMLKVLQHANKNGIKSFKTAFLDLNHADLLKRAEERGKESIAKERQKQTKLGLLGKSSTPSKGIQAAKDYKNKSYDELMREGLEELGIS